MMTKQEFLELCPAYALGALDAQELESFMNALAGADAEMLTAFADAVSVAENLSLTAEPATPSSKVKENLMARIHETKTETRVESVRAPWKTAEVKVSWMDRLFPSPRFGMAAAFALLILTVGLASYVFHLRENIGRQKLALVTSRHHIVALEDSLSQKNAMLDVIRSKDMHLVVMSGLDVNPSGFGKVLWDPVRKIAVLQVSLPAEASDKDYQLWVIRDKKPVDAGVFQVSDVGSNGSLYKIDHLVETDKNHINAFAITLEPKGGVPQPTGKMYLLGSTML